MMKFWLKTMLLALTMLLVTAVLAPNAVTTAQGQNLLKNPGFEEGHHYQNDIAELVVPDNWLLHWLEKTSFDGADNRPAFRPNTVVWNSGDAPTNEKSLFWKDGIYTFKAYTTFAPLYAALSQDVSGLEVGRRYRLTAPIYVDVFADYQNSQKIAPGELDHAQMRLGASPVGAPWLDASQISYSGWVDGNNTSPFYQAYTTLNFDFTASKTDMTVWIEFRARYPHPNNGFFMDGFSLVALDTTGVPPTVNPNAPTANPNAPTADPNAPTSTPLPTATPRADGAVVHIVQSGDTFWNIAIQYASTLGTTPEQALTLIKELNGNPAFINVGQELVIVPPSTQAQPTAVATQAALATDSAPDETTSAETPAATSAATESAETTPAATEAAATAQPTAVPTISTGSVCVSSFDDKNGDGTRDPNTEGLLSDAALKLLRNNNTVATYISDGLQDTYCFEDLEPDTYQLSFSPPNNYRATTQDNGWLSVTSGAKLPVAFGAKFDATAVSVAPQATSATDDTADNTASVQATPAATAIAVDVASDAGEASNNIGLIVGGAGILLLIIAGVGVLLLRRA